MNEHFFSCTTISFFVWAKWRKTVFSSVSYLCPLEFDGVGDGGLLRCSCCRCPRLMLLWKYSSSVSSSFSSGIKWLWFAKAIWLVYCYTINATLHFVRLLKWGSTSVVRGCAGWNVLFLPALLPVSIGWPIRRQRGARDRVALEERSCTSLWVEWVDVTQMGCFTGTCPSAIEEKVWAQSLAIKHKNYRLLDFFCQ